MVKKGDRGCVKNEGCVIFDGLRCLVQRCGPDVSEMSVCCK